MQLRRSKARVYIYATQAPLPMVGLFEEIVESKHKITTAKFHVAKGHGGNLLFRETATELDLMTLNVNNVNMAKPEARTGTKDNTTSGQQSNTNTPSNDSFIQHLTTTYQDLFDGVRCLKNFELKFHINPDVSPVAQPERRLTRSWTNSQRLLLSNPARDPPLGCHRWL